MWTSGARQPAVTVTRKKKLRCRRLFSDRDVVIPPRQQIQAPARSTLSSLTAPTGTEIVEAREVKPGVYVGRAILAPEHRHQRVNVVNTTETPMVLRSGTWLGTVQRVDVVQYPKGTGARHAMLVKYSIQHRPGVKHGNADALSRRPRTDSTGDSEVTRQGHSGEDNDNAEGLVWNPPLPLRNMEIRSTGKGRRGSERPRK